MKKTGMLGSFLRCALMVAALGMIAAGTAQAVDAPKWVAALYVEAQRAVGLRWMPVPGATGYKVLRSEKAGADYKELTTSAQPQYFDTATEAGATYYYVLQAVAGAESSAMSAEKAITIPGQKVKKVAPPEWAKEAVVSETTEFGKTSFRVGLFWKRNTDAIAYNLYKSTTKGKDYALLVSGAETQAVDSAVEAGKTYYYVVSALDGSFQETPFSTEVAVAVEKKKEVEAAAKRVKLVVAPRATKKLWAKTKGDDNGKFGLWEPFDIALDAAGDVLYAVSNNTGQVYVLNASTGELIAVWGERGLEPGKFGDLLGLHFYDGHVYAVDGKRRVIAKFTGSGTFVKEFPLVVPKELEAVVGVKVLPRDVVIDPANGDIYVCDVGVGRIWVLDSAGKFQRFIGDRGTAVGKLHGPMYLDWDKDGNLAVLDMNASRLATYTKEGVYVRSFGRRDAQVGAFVFLGGFGLDKDGRVYMVDKASSSIQGFLPDGRYLFHLADEQGKGGINIYAPKTAIIDAKNRVFVCEGLVDRVQAFQITGAVPPPQEAEPAPAEK